MKVAVQHQCRRGCDSHHPGEWYDKRTFRNPLAAVLDLRRRRKTAWASTYRLRVSGFSGNVAQGLTIAFLGVVVPLSILGFLGGSGAFALGAIIALSTTVSLVFLENGGSK